ncbi:TniQ family protein [Dechloromonas sp. XY25]|uniref:TniQ family protein n=1 Tax=Dechloromonas hankyongensis TaxID=2908002 RepID=A0ABS9K4R1_9RHOO|nr:TniQ family protein [Dechloromonas hankyongensis]MCG2578049.1 TniQ family protein [Dechloromonas hankyongensis]
MESVDLSFLPEFSGFDNLPDIPPRSRLFSLEPIGIGTPMSEGLKSYIIRLAEAYSISPRRLIREEFTKFAPELANYRYFGPTKYAIAIDGLYRYSELFARSVENLCGLPEARNLTLQPLNALLPFTGVGMCAPRWCSSCYAEMRESRQQLYQPLAWSLDLYHVCPRHEKTMVDRCPSCNKLQYLIPRIPMIGYCCYCGTWMGKPLNKSPPATSFELWVSTAIGEIIAELSKLGNLATRDRFLRQLMEAVDCFADGGRREFCRRIGLPDAAFQIWITGGKRPCLARWLEISYGLGIGPVRFLEEKFASVSETTVLRKLPYALTPRASSPQLTAAERHAIEVELTSVAEAGSGAFSVTALAERHGLARRHLQSLWPDQCRKISADFKENAKIQWNEKRAQQCRITKETVNSLLERGLYPSQRTMQNALNRFGLSLVNPAIRDAYKQQLWAKLLENNGNS